MEAQKIKKKLNGSILKGTKVNIEVARPIKQKRQDKETGPPIPEAGDERYQISSKVRKPATDTLPGIELRDRKVKRGWTDPVGMKKADKKSKSKKDAVKSKYTSGPELLFKTTLPANKASSIVDLSGTNGEKKRKRKQEKEVVVHEFSKTTKYASFLRSSAIPSTAKGVAEYVEGKGWVDGSGSVVEAPLTKPKRAGSRKVQVTPDILEPSVSIEAEEPNPKDSREVTEEGPTREHRQAQTKNDEVSSSGTSSDQDDESDGDESSNSESGEEISSHFVEEPDDTRPLPSPKTLIHLKIDIPKNESPTEADAAPAVHPLEALFKRRRPNLEAPKIPETVPSFSFFNPDEEDDEERDVVDSFPMTPYTKQEFALRGLRSAAPTPDTAFPGKPHNIWPSNKTSRDDDVGMDVDATPTQKLKIKEARPEEESAAAPVSDFQKWFYENRGENNRAWKRRRKVAAKEKRHRENKRKNERDV